MRKRTIVAIILGLIIFISLPAMALETPEDDIVSHELLWSEATASVLAIASMSDINAASIEVLKPAQERLERSVVGLLGATTPVPRVADHFFLLPAIQEVAAATRAAVEAKEKQDEPGIESAQAWFDESLVKLSAALQQVQKTHHP